MSDDWRKPENHRIWWRIAVGGYGEYAVYGDQFEAEEDRIAKARWEKAPAFKEPIPRDHQLVLQKLWSSKYKTIYWLERSLAKKREDQKR